MKNKDKNEYFLEASAWMINGLVASIKNIEDRDFVKNDVFQCEFRNYGRLDAMSKSVCAALAVLLSDAGLYPCKSKLEIPLFFSSETGPLLSDIDYYSDFAKFGEQAGRANLFVYTLPTSPLGEASVHFGLTGPAEFIYAEDNIKVLCENAVDNALIHEFDRFLIGVGELNESGNADVLFMLFSKSTNLRTSQIPLSSVAELKKAAPCELKHFLQFRGRFHHFFDIPDSGETVSVFS